MKKALFLLLFVVSSCPAVGKVTYSWTPTAGDTVTAAKMKKNQDSTKAVTDRIIDTLNRNTASITALDNYLDSGSARIFTYAQVDTGTREDSVDIKWDIAGHKVSLHINYMDYPDSAATIIMLLPIALAPEALNSMVEAIPFVFADVFGLDVGAAMFGQYYPHNIALIFAKGYLNPNIKIGALLSQTLTYWIP